jgi:hypothetical protein
MAKPKFTTYAKITDEQSQAIVTEYRNCKRIAGPNFDPGHLAACVAVDVFDISDDAWNGPTGSNAWAAVLATLVMKGEIKPVDGGKQ